MMELHQFRHSAFCLKVRMVLQAKGLSYRTVEVAPGMGQVAVFRMSGQRQVPVLVDGDVVVADSSAIARHLEQREPSPALILRKQTNLWFHQDLEVFLVTSYLMVVLLHLLQKRLTHSLHKTRPCYLASLLVDAMSVPTRVLQYRAAMNGQLCYHLGVETMSSRYRSATLSEIIAY